MRSAQRTGCLPPVSHHADGGVPARLLGPAPWPGSLARLLGPAPWPGSLVDGDQARPAVSPPKCRGRSSWGTWAWAGSSPPAPSRPPRSAPPPPSLMRWAYREPRARSDARGPMRPRFAGGRHGSVAVWGTCGSVAASPSPPGLGHVREGGGLAGLASHSLEATHPPCLPFATPPPTHPPGGRSGSCRAGLPPAGATCAGPPAGAACAGPLSTRGLRRAAVRVVVCAR